MGEEAGKGRLSCNIWSGWTKDPLQDYTGCQKRRRGHPRYVHLGTGNYNDSTAKLYTDCGILTCNEAIGEDATAVFNMLSGYSEPLSWNHLAWHRCG